MKYYWFGDSWVAGDELDNSALAFPQLVSDHYHAECVNLGRCGSSITAIPHVFNTVFKNITDSDRVFFFLTEPHRTSLVDSTNQLKNIIPSKMAKHLVHDHVDQWYRYFDNPFQRAYNNTCTVNLLYLWCKHLGISCYFSNIFNTTNNDYVDGIDWLLPQSRCIAECILPVINNDAFLFDDNPNLTVDEWSKQKPAVEKYIKPNFVHPNADGHRKIADYIIELLDAKTS